MTDRRLIAFHTYGELALQEVVQRHSADGLIDPSRGITLRFTTPVRFGDLRRAVSFTPPVELPVGIESRDSDRSTELLLPVTFAPSTDYTLETSKFNGKIKWVQIDLGEDDHGHMIDPAHVIHVALSRQ